MQQKLDCEKSRAEKYWEKFSRENQAGVIGAFQRWLKKKKQKGRSRNVKNR